MFQVRPLRNYSLMMPLIGESLEYRQGLINIANRNINKTLDVVLQQHRDILKSKLIR